MAEETRHPNGAPTVEYERPIREYEGVPAAGLGGYPALRRVSWGAIFAGTVVALVTSLVLGLLGIAIGASTVDPLSERVPTSGLGVGAGLWWVGTGMIATFLGGWVAARLAGNPRRFDAILHGVVTWGLATIVTFLLITTIVGRIIGGAFGVLGTGLETLGQGAVTATGQLAEIATAQQQQQQQLEQQIRGEAQQQGAQPSPQLDQAITALFDGDITAQDRAAVVQILTTQTGLEQNEAERLVDQWAQQIQQATGQWEELRQQVMAQTRQASEAVATGITWGSLWAFIGLLLMAATAALGGWLGRPREALATPTSSRAPPRT